MPIEIRELVIRATVTESAAQQQRLEAALERMRQQILQQCADRIEDLLERRGER